MTLVLLCGSEFLGQMGGEEHWSVHEDIKFSQEVKIERKAPPSESSFQTVKTNSAPSWLNICIISSAETAF